MLDRLLKLYINQGKMLIIIIFMLNLTVGMLCIMVSYTANSFELIIAGIFNLLMAIQTLLSYLVLLKIKTLRKISKVIINKN